MLNTVLAIVEVGRHLEPINQAASRHSHQYDSTVNAHFDSRMR